MEKVSKNQAVTTPEQAREKKNKPQTREKKEQKIKKVTVGLNQNRKGGLRNDALKQEYERARNPRDEIKANTRQ